jgi:putative transposase
MAPELFEPAFEIGCMSVAWPNNRFILSYRDVEELLVERGLEVSFETIRRWVLKFGAPLARRCGKRRPRPSDQWHLDEMVVRIKGERMYFWRAVDHEVRTVTFDVPIRPSMLRAAS